MLRNFLLSSAVPLVFRFLQNAWAGTAARRLSPPRFQSESYKASETQNNYVLSFWLVCLAYFTMDYLQNGGFLSAAACGISWGLALLTKGTAYIYAAPFMGCLLIRVIKELPRKPLRHFVALGIIALFLNSGQYLRNVSLTGSPLGAADEPYFNAAFSPNALISNLLRNSVLHFGTQNQLLNMQLNSTLDTIHHALGIDLNDSRTTWPNEIFQWPVLSFDEDHAPNLLHAAGFPLVIAAFLVSPRLRRRQELSYLLVVLTAGLIFCLILRWQPWNTRLHLPLFVLLCPLIALILARITTARSVTLLGVVALLACLPTAFRNPTGPLIGPVNLFNTPRSLWYFGSSIALLPDYESISLLECKQIGLSIGANSYEYPIWVFAKNARIEHINVTNISQKLTNLDEEFIPCAIISDTKDATPFTYQNRIYVTDNPEARLKIYRLAT